MIVDRTSSKKLVATSINEVTDTEDIIHVLVSDKIEVLRKMMAIKYREILQKGNTVVLNKDKDTQITIFNDVEYSDTNEENSEFVSTHLHTFAKNSDRVVYSNRKTRRNPKFVDNPECQFCYKKATKLYSAKLLDKNQTEKQVCNKCKKDLARMRVIVAKMEVKS